MPRADPGAADYLRRWGETHGGYDAAANPWTRGWLMIVHRAAAPLVRRRVHPDLLTLVGLAVSALVPVLALGRVPALLMLAVPVVVLSGLVDSLDGAVALLADRSTRFGYVLDSLVDRLTELAYLLALYLAGAPGWLVVLAGLPAWLLEYVRARAVGAGLTEIAVLTVWERATRVVVTAVGLFLAGVAALALPGPLDRPRGDVVAWVSAGTAGLWVALGAVGLVQLLVTVRRQLLAPLES
jgi:CDP-diacylglycerol--glycerol-3-phosphate 3-phosphatidyltransferase